jgi:hypothetical protein
MVAMKLFLITDNLESITKYKLLIGGSRPLAIDS